MMMILFSNINVLCCLLHTSYANGNFKLNIAWSTVSKVAEKSSRSRTSIPKR